MSSKVVQAVQQKFGEAVIATHDFRGDDTLVVRREALRAIGEFLRDDQEMAFDMPIDCTCVDFPKRPERFDVVYHLYSTSHRHRVRLKVPVTAESCTCPSLTPIWKGFNWFERETYDMFGIRFEGHGDLRLCYEKTSLSAEGDETIYFTLRNPLPNLAFRAP